MKKLLIILALLVSSCMVDIGPDPYNAGYGYWYPEPNYCIVLLTPSPYGWEPYQYYLAVDYWVSNMISIKLWGGDIITWNGHFDVLPVRSCYGY